MLFHQSPIAASRLLEGEITRSVLLEYRNVKEKRIRGSQMRDSVSKEGAREYIVQGEWRVGGGGDGGVVMKDEAIQGLVSLSQAPPDGEDGQCATYR